MTLHRVAPNVNGDEPVADRCPWCDQLIPHERFDEIHKRIEAKERERAAKIEAKANAEIARARKEAAAAVETATKAAKAQADAARDEATKPTELAMAKKVAEAEKLKVA